MALECVAGTIEVRQIMDQVDLNESTISINTSDIAILETDVLKNSEDITNHELRIASLEGGNVPTQGAFDALKDRVGVNEVNIAANATAIQTNTSLINDNTSEIVNNKSEIDVNTASIADLENELVNTNTSVGTNSTRISALEDLHAKSALLVHETLDGVDGGAAAANTWVTRNIGTVKSDTLGGLSGPTSYSVPPGEYKISVIAIASAPFHQTRLNIGGVTTVGTTVSGQNQSVSTHTISLSSDTSVSVETKISAVGSGKELGEANPFGEPNLYVSLTIQKVG